MFFTRKKRAASGPDLKLETREGHLGGYVLDRPAPGTWCPDVWTWLVNDHQIRSVLDVGCGLGFVMRYFRDLGCEVHGVDGSTSAVEKNPLRGSVTHHDFTVGPWVPHKKYDLIWSSELVEHVEEKYVGNLLLAFAGAGKLLVITYARPGQGGHHHVNEQDEDYWVEKMKMIGFVCDRALTLHARRLIPRQGVEGMQFRDKGLVFAKAKALET